MAMCHLGVGEGEGKKKKNVELGKAGLFCCVCRLQLEAGYG